MTVREASSLLGISPKTLRRWADAGRIPVTTTAGGHRRFQRDAVEHALRGEAEPHEQRLAAVERLIGDAMRHDCEALATVGPEGPGSFASVERDALRQRGRDLLAVLLRHLETSGRPSARLLAAACRLGADYGRDLARIGVSLSAATAAFAQFEVDFTEEVARMLRARGPAGRDPLDVMVEAQRAATRVLGGVLAGYGEAVGASQPAPG